MTSHHPGRETAPDTVIPGAAVAAETDESHDTAERTVTPPTGRRIA